MSTRNGKRKADSDSEESETTAAKAPTAKRTKPSATQASGSGSGGAVVAAGSTSGSRFVLPTNKVMPVRIEFPKPAEGSIRISAWNVCGLKPSLKKGFKFYVEGEDPDILVLTETKMNNTPVDPFLTNRYKYQYWSDAVKGQAGTAIMSKFPALKATYNLPGLNDPTIVAGRIVTLEFKYCYIIGTYVPNAGEKLKSMERKKTWNTAFEAHIRALDAKKPVIWTGDLNVVPTAIDIARAKENYNKSPGYTDIEINAFRQTLAPSPTIEGSERLVDVWREMHPGDPHYTYYGYRGNCREKGIGWRLDFYILSERLVSRVKQCEIRHTIYGASDHVPIILDLEGDL